MFHDYKVIKESKRSDLIQRKWLKNSQPITHMSSLQSTWLSNKMI